MAIFAPQFADVAKLVDAPDLGSGVERRGGSSPFIRTNIPASGGHVKRFYEHMIGCREGHRLKEGNGATDTILRTTFRTASGAVI